MKRTALLLLCGSLIVGMLSGCAQKEAEYTPTGDGLTWEEDYSGPVNTRPEQEPQKLTFTYYPDRSMHPYESTDFTNRALLSLIYQSLFISDRNYRVEPLLCSKYTVSEDMKTYTFYVEEATFSDGKTLTAQDVLASLKAAKESDYYGGRFTYVSDMHLSDDGGVVIGLSTPNENLPLLLDIPILQEGQIHDSAPLGTGPYVFEKTDSGASLRRRTDWWCNPEMAVTAEEIPLITAESPTQIRDNFQFSGLNLVCADPGSDRYSDYRCDYELWDCETGNFLYLTCNEVSKVFSVPEVRTAVTHAIDREKIVDTFFRGFARAASLPASPLSPYYSSTLAAQYGYNPKVFADAVTAAGFKDTEVSLLVNKDDSLRVRVARAVGKMLEAGGLKVNLKELSGKDYAYALNSRNFDLFLGQTKLSPNMDLSPFFAGNGVLSWGGVDDASIYALCLKALENQGNYYTLHQNVMKDGMLCPIAFGSYAVFATRGLVTDLSPARDNIFRYSLGKTMEKALEQPQTPDAGSDS